ncbi:sugar ABC transporter ATP-binding protein [Shinella daejeonensis]|uniref:sugar ABC transporter ATP-binding protein n=1 Tax=Shinella daejeonensis TaxID=659017 RepID=UPI0020C7A530|nr:sugar ABC transporter ATP-binding protein [Shinella daejeonensis]MCP8894586.1 sugar ABC transporter ATP-binding protein [Shinella daejeonensis]
MSSRTTAASETPVLLEMRNISKTFGAHRALREVRIAVHAGEVHALMGENGAGKSTLTSILCGMLSADAGAEILVDGAVKPIRSPIDARRLGIAIIHQELALADNITVMENMTLGNESACLGFRSRARMRARCEPVLERLGLAWARDRKVGTLSVAEQQMVEIARALMADARVIVMDEPTTSLSLRETDRLFAIVRELRAEGRAVIYISHRMNEIYELADRVSVLRDGAFIGELDRADVTAEKLVAMMVGRDLSTFYTKEGSERVVRDDAPVVLSVDGVGDGGWLGPCSLEIRAGEILGLAGLVGAGRTELARLIYGADRPQTGTVTLSGKPLCLKGPVDAIDAGIAYLTEDRKGLGLLLDMSVHSNINLNVIADDATGATVLNASAGTKRSAQAIAAMNIRVRGPETIVGTLSGGNQQKVLLARLLQRKPRVILLDEPTRGVDVGAKSEIYKIINNLAAEGAAVLVISSELPELIGLSDRILVMREGRIAGEVGGGSGVAISQEAIIGIATGSDAITARA